MSEIVSQPNGPRYVMDVIGVHGNPIRAVLYPLARDYKGEVRGEISFYDLRYTPWENNARIVSGGDRPEPRDPADGQFIGAYIVGGYMGFLDGRIGCEGLNLYGGEPTWQIAGAEMSPLVKWVRQRCEVAGTDLSTDMPGVKR